MEKLAPPPHDIDRAENDKSSTYKKRSSCILYTDKYTGQKMVFGGIKKFVEFKPVVKTGTIRNAFLKNQKTYEHHDFRLEKLEYR